MTADIPKYASADTAAELLRGLGGQFAVVANPQYIFPPYDFYPFASPALELAEGLHGAVMDMDGTTTTTEPLCIHSLDTMARRITNRPTPETWPGLDRERDYPHIIGNSTTKHVEYLVETYGPHIELDAVRQWHIQAAAWTLGQGADEGRRREVRANLAALGVGALLADARFQALQGAQDIEGTGARALLHALTSDYGPAYALAQTPDLVRASVDIYYQRYHEILSRIQAGEGASVAASVLGQTGGHLIEPMPGVGVYLALIKGWLGEDAAGCAPILVDHLRKTGHHDGVDLEGAPALLRKLGAHFAAHPARAAIVTSSIEYEARIVLGEVFRILQEQVDTWAIPEAKRKDIRVKFADPIAFYDGFITASDSSEIRLKPHRDLYSLALHRIGILPQDFGNVAGFEDSESGTIAIRAAGIPLCCALPFHMTQGHTFHAATHTCPGGLPEVILRHHAFLPARTLA